MKKYSILLIIFLFVFVSSGWTQEEETATEDVSAEASVAERSFKTFNIYTDNTSKDNHYAPSGWMGDYGDIKMSYGYNKNPHSGTTCIRIEYRAIGKQDAGWAGIYWQNPPNNWGDKKGGYSLTGAKKLTFWVKGARGYEKIRVFKVGGISGQYTDSDTASIGPVILKRKWTKYVIDLQDRDLSYISGGFCWVATASDNPTGMVFYLDDIKFE